MKLRKSKKGGAFLVGLAAHPLALAAGIILLLSFTIGLGGIIKFLVSDKTPLIIGGAFVLLFLFSKRKR